jgi:parallel beta-helix repeat protein
MKNELIAKSFVFGIVVLFFGAGVTSAYNAEPYINSQPMNRGNILYVGGSGEGNYTTIQLAIDNSSNGDTVFVYNKTYNENIDTKLKKISIIGEDRDTTIIHGQTTDPVVRIGTSDTSISGFTINGTSKQIIIQVAPSEDIFITNNLIEDGTYGIVLAVATSTVTITNNIIMNNLYIGIQLKTSTYNLIQGNSIEDNGAQGIEISDISHHNSILNNTIINNANEGILASLASTENTIQKNNISNNQIGVRFTGGSGSNKIIGNNIEGSDMEGVLLQTSKENVIETNNFIDNNRQATFKLSSRNTWNANYWSNWIGFKLTRPLFQKFPKVIIGVLGINFDKNPAKQPYNISIII